MTKALTLFLSTLLATAAVQAELTVSTNLKTKITKEVDVSFVIQFPKEYESDKKKKWPLLMFLHGAGERGDNIERVKVHGPPKLVKNGENLPFIVVSPQCPKNEIWDNDNLLALLDHVIEQHRVDSKRVYLTGLSMGGFGTFNLGLTYPERFAAIAPICGGGDWIKIYAAKGAKPQALQNLAVWVFHGEKDGVVLPEQSKMMVAGLKKYGCKEVKLTLYPDAGHDAWTATYNNPELYDWFLSHTLE